MALLIGCEAPGLEETEINVSLADGGLEGKLARPKSAAAEQIEIKPGDRLGAIA